MLYYEQADALFVDILLTVQNVQMQTKERTYSDTDFARASFRSRKIEHEHFLSIAVRPPHTHTDPHATPVVPLRTLWHAVCRIIVDATLTSKPLAVRLGQGLTLWDQEMANDLVRAQATRHALITRPYRNLFASSAMRENNEIVVPALLRQNPSTMFRGKAPFILIVSLPPHALDTGATHCRAIDETRRNAMHFLSLLECPQYGALFAEHALLAGNLSVREGMSVYEDEIITKRQASQRAQERQAVVALTRTAIHLQGMLAGVVPDTPVFFMAQTRTNDHTHASHTYTHPHPHPQPHSQPPPQTHIQTYTQGQTHPHSFTHTHPQPYTHTAFPQQPMVQSVSSSSSVPAHTTHTQHSHMPVTVTVAVSVPVPAYSPLTHNIHRSQLTQHTQHTLVPPVYTHPHTQGYNEVSQYSHFTHPDPQHTSTVSYTPPTQYTQQAYIRHTSHTPHTTQPHVSHSTDTQQASQQTAHSEAHSSHTAHTTHIPPPSSPFPPSNEDAHTLTEKYLSALEEAQAAHKEHSLWTRADLREMAQEMARKTIAGETTFCAALEAITAFVCERKTSKETGKDVRKRVHDDSESNRDNCDSGSSDIGKKDIVCDSGSDVCVDSSGPTNDVSNCGVENVCVSAEEKNQRENKRVRTLTG